MICLLAAMDGMTNAAFRSVCFEYGADGATTEMIPALGFARAKRRLAPIVQALFTRRPEEKNLAAQILGSEPAVMAKAAKRLEDMGRFDAIEVNMGCPARVVVGSGNGSFLLTQPERAGEILRAVAEAVDLPVRLKLRLGWDAAHITAPQIARAAQQAGCRELILHGRTREQQYGGAVDLARMREVISSVSIPVYANGGVTCARDAQDFARETGAAGVAIGRAALKAPWIFEDIGDIEAGRPPRVRDAAERIDVMLRIASRLCAQKPENFAVCEMRKLCAWYLDGLTGADEVFETVKRTETLNDLRRALGDYLDGLTRSGDTLPHPENMRAQTLDTVRRT